MMRFASPRWSSPTLSKRATTTSTSRHAGALTVGRTVIDTNFRAGKEPNARVAMNADTERFGRFVLDTLINH